MNLERYNRILEVLKDKELDLLVWMESGIDGEDWEEATGKLSDCQQAITDLRVMYELLKELNDI